MTTTMLNKLCIYDHVSWSSCCLKDFVRKSSVGRGGGGKGWGQRSSYKRIVKFRVLLSNV